MLDVISTEQPLDVFLLILIADDINFTIQSFD